MRLLFITPYYEPAYAFGGPARSIPALCQALAREGAEVEVFSTDAAGPGRRLQLPLEIPLLRQGVLVHYFKHYGGRFFYAPALGRACRERLREFDIAHIFALWTYPAWPASLGARRHGVATVESLRGALMPWDYARRRLKKALYMALAERRRLNMAAALHCTSQAESKALQPLGLRPPRYVVPNGLDTEGLQVLPPRGVLRQRLGIGPEEPLSLFMGRLSAKKGLELMLRAFALVASAGRGHLVLAGPQEEGWGHRARALAAELAIAELVHFVGLLEARERLGALADADLLVLLSWSENFGMVVAEAMAAGLAVLVSEHVGLAPDVRRAGAGLVVPMHTQEAARAWRQLLESPRRRALMGRRGRAFARRHYDWQQVARQMLKVYEEVLGKRR
jgi:glycosyltransferase involved in cell wall biosynthesis